MKAKRCKQTSTFSARQKKTGAYIIIAWCVQPAWGWQHLRYSRIKEMSPVGSIMEYHDDFDPYDIRLGTIDTQIFRLCRPVPAARS
jgi:hypothetical protein